MSAFIVENRNAWILRPVRSKTRWVLAGSETAELVFEDCRVPAANMLGKQEQGLQNRNDGS